VVTVGGGDVGVSGQARDADGQRMRSVAITRGALPRSDQGLVLRVGGVADPVELVFYLPVPADPGGKGDRVRGGVAGDQIHDLDGFFPFFVTVRRTCATWAASAKSIQADASTALMVRRARRPWPVLTDKAEGTEAQGNFLSCQTARATLFVLISRRVKQSKF
jgi:hypothetical protein